MLILPDNFRAFPDLVVCGNRLIRGVAPLALGKQPIFLVGQGDVPKVWLSVPSGEPNSFVTLVSDNESQHSGVLVDTLAPENRIVIRIEETVILDTTKLLEDMAVVKALDLRPVGLEVFGNEGGLNVGGMSLVGNAAEGAEVLIGLGD